MGTTSNENRSFNKMDHSGTITNQSTVDSSITFNVKMNITSDSWIKGGEANYKINLNINGDVITGSFEGEFNPTCN